MSTFADSILDDSDSLARVDETTTGMDIAPVLATVPYQPKLARPKRKKLRRRVSRISEDESGDEDEQDQDLIPDDADEIIGTGVEHGKDQDDVSLPPVEPDPIHASYAVVAPDFTPGAREKVDVSKIKAAGPDKSAPGEPHAESELTQKPDQSAVVKPDPVLGAIVAKKAESVSQALASAGLEVSTILDESQLESMSRAASIMRMYS